MTEPSDSVKLERFDIIKSLGKEADEL